MKKHMTQEVAIKSAWMILEGLGFSREINGDLEKTVTAVYESAPAADVVEVRHGRWQFEIDENMPWCTKAICTSCKQVVADNADLAQTWGKGLFLHDNLYCPRCGAKMYGGQDE